MAVGSSAANQVFTANTLDTITSFLGSETDRTAARMAAAGPSNWDNMSAPTQASNNVAARDFSEVAQTLEPFIENRGNFPNFASRALHMRVGAIPGMVAQAVENNGGRVPDMRAQPPAGINLLAGIRPV